MSTNIYQDIAARTGGDIYIGVVGPVRTGKSTFIKRFMDLMVLPNIKSEFERERAIDELPQSSAGRTIMTTEPKFIPENAITINLDNSASFNVRLIDCVGFIVPSSLGYIEDNGPRMVATPWYEEPIPFNLAAEIGTQKVIKEHSTIGLVVTTDGSISDIPREEYEEAEERVIAELKAIDRPFVVLLNTLYPTSEESQMLAKRLSDKYGVTVISSNCMELSQDELNNIISMILYEFPIREIAVSLPMWITALAENHWLKSAIFDTVRNCTANIKKIKDVFLIHDDIVNNEHIKNAVLENFDLGKGSAKIVIELDKNLFYAVLAESTGLTVENDQQLMTNIIELAEIKKKYMRVKNALDEVEATGYGIVMPDIEELSLEEPEIVKQGGRFGVRLHASAPSIHMMKANITTEVSPIVGSEKQSEDLIMYLLKEFEEDPIKIWDSNIFGKSLHSLVNEGLHTKLSRMPSDARMRLQQTLERVINDGCSGLICIIL
ncbi:MAG: stage IV sporulation protein A [bacterium]|nr:stage IV sporulation protein A [bacterium]